VPTGADYGTTRPPDLVCHLLDMDLGDSWEHADNPSIRRIVRDGIRIGVINVVYAMTH